MEELQPGQIISAYEVIRLLGAGGMGAVYEVVHRQLDVHYALKTFILEEGHAALFRERFAVEGKILARLRHPNLIRVFDLGYDEPTGVLYYVMDLVLYKDGETHTLDDLEQGGADEDQMAEWFREICAALDYVHGQGIVHRDIKLNNILLGPDRHVLLSDFGISRIADDKLRQDMNVERTIVTGVTGGRLAMGTQGYMAPEIKRGEEATAAADVYSLGIAFFKLLTGVWYDPCLAPGAKTDSSCGIDSVKLLSHFDYNWQEVLPAMLSERPEDRPTNMGELAGWLREKPVAAPQRSERKVWPWVVAAAVMLSLTLAALWWFLRPNALPAAPTGEEDDLAAAFDIPESLK